MQDSSRWWEFYFVRYAIGTLTGALLINQVPRISEELSNVIFFQIDLQKDAYAGIPLLLGYGLLFCYIASIPILIWHSARFVIPKINDFVPSKFRERFGSEMSALKKGLAVGSMIAIGLVLLSVQIFLSKNLSNQDFLIKIGVYASLGVLWLEWGALIWLLANMERAYQSMRSLAIARNKNKNEGGLIDSYKHLREHGNSILIVLLEFVLGGVLLGMLYVVETDDSVQKAEKINAFATHAAPVIALWMIPGAVIWLIAVAFEKRFVDLENSA